MPLAHIQKIIYSYSSAHSTAHLLFSVHWSILQAELCSTNRAKNEQNKNNNNTGRLRGIRTPSKQQQQPVPQKQQQQQHPLLGMQQLPHHPPHCQASQLKGCLQ